MHTLARAVILATKYLDCRIDDDTLDDDVRALEDVAAELQNASVDEKLCLIRAAQELGFESWPDEMGIL